MSWVDTFRRRTKNVIVSPLYLFNIGTKRTWHKVRGIASSNARAGYLFNTLKNFKSREIMELKVEKAEMKNIERIKSRLKGFNKDTFNKMYRANHNKPVKLKKNIEEIVQVYIHDLEEYKKSSEHLLNAIEHSVANIQEVRVNLSEDLLKYVREAESKSKKQQFNMPPEAVDKAIQNIRREIGAQHNKINRIQRKRKQTYDSLSTGRKATAGFSSFMGLSLTYYKTYRAIDKIWTGARFERLLEVMQELDRQLNEGLQADFLSLVEEHASNMAEIHSMTSELEKDIMHFLEQLVSDQQAINKSIAEFLSIFKNEPEVKDAKQAFQKLEKNKEDIETAIKNETYSDKDIMNKINELNKQLPKLIQSMRQTSKNTFNSINEHNAEEKINQMLKN